MEGWQVALLVLAAVFVGALLPLLAQLYGTLRTLRSVMDKSAKDIEAAMVAIHNTSQRLDRLGAALEKDGKINEIVDGLTNAAHLREPDARHHADRRKRLGGGGPRGDRGGPGLEGGDVRGPFTGRAAEPAAPREFHTAEEGGFRMSQQNGGVGAGTVLFAFLAGAAVGGVVALLFAPESGQKTRQKLLAMGEDARESIGRVPHRRPGGREGCGRDVYRDDEEGLAGAAALAWRVPARGAYFSATRPGACQFNHIDLLH